MEAFLGIPFFLDGVFIVLVNLRGCKEGKSK